MKGKIIMVRIDVHVHMYMVTVVFYIDCTCTHPSIWTACTVVLLSKPSTTTQ